MVAFDIGKEMYARNIGLSVSYVFRVLMSNMRAVLAQFVLFNEF